MTERLPKHNEIQEIVENTKNELDPLFKRMELAEEEIAVAMENDPANADLYNRSFILLAPTEPLNTDLLFQRHCQEILYRVAEGLDTRPGTDAEVLGALKEASLRMPMNTSGALAYARMFRRCFPEYEEEANELEASTGRERYEGQVDELIATVRRKLTVKERVLGEEA